MDHTPDDFRKVHANVDKYQKTRGEGGESEPQGQQELRTARAKTSTTKGNISNHVYTLGDGQELLEEA